MTFGKTITGAEALECPICQNAVGDVVEHIERKHPAIAFPGKFRFWRKPAKAEASGALVALALLRRGPDAYWNTLSELTGLSPEAISGNGVAS